MKKTACLLLWFQTALLFLLWAAPCRAADLPKAKEFVLGQYDLEHPYKAMAGPVKTKDVALAPESASPYLWIRSFSVNTVDADGTPDSIGYLCHAAARLPGGGFLTHSEGFPEGFAIKIPNTPGAKITLQAQAQNYGLVPKHISFKMRIGYFEDADAKRLGLRPLTSATIGSVIFSEHPSDDSGIAMLSKNICHISQRDPANSTTRPRLTTFFEVPPGRHEYRSDVPQSQYGNHFYRDGVIHYIQMHLHDYGESIELYDKTAQKSVWKGYAKARPDGELTETDVYSSVQGLRVYKDHVYELVTTYNNTSKYSVDAMGLLRIYFEDSASQ